MKFPKDLLQFFSFAKTLYFPHCSQKHLLCIYMKVKNTNITRFYNCYSIVVVIKTLILNVDKLLAWLYEDISDVILCF